MKTLPLALLLALYVPGQLTMSETEREVMFIALSDACRAESGATPDEAASLLAGRSEDTPTARKHVYCVYRCSKIVGKDGKPMKTAVLDKLTQRANEKDASSSRMLEECGQQGGAAPEDFAWNLFRCGHDEKKRLFGHFRAALGSPDNV